jgi:hypothetical protein
VRRCGCARRLRSGAEGCEDDGGSEVDERGRCGQSTPLSDRGQLSGAVFFSPAVVLRSDSACSISSAHSPDDVDNLDDLPNEGDRMLKIPQRRRPSAPSRHVQRNVSGHNERGTGSRALTREGSGLSMAEARRDEEEERRGEER